jgi:hypothetical protein
LRRRDWNLTLQNYVGALAKFNPSGFLFGCSKDKLPRLFAEGSDWLRKNEEWLAVQARQPLIFSNCTFVSLRNAAAYFTVLRPMLS